MAWDERLESIPDRRCCISHSSWLDIGDQLVAVAMCVAGYGNTDVRTAHTIAAVIVRLTRAYLGFSFSDGV